MTQAQPVNREPTMEEILASIRRIIEDGNATKIGDMDDEPEQPAVKAAEPHHVPDLDAFSREFAEADVFAKPVQQAVAQTIDVRTEPVFAVPDVRSEADAVIETLEIAPAPESPAILNVPSPLQELRPIISEAAGRQVAKSFEHLQVALQEERQTSVASLTEDMLRPMLQDWLDNNLPTLVERLVREEIERVSRGAR